jgi:hypothetical protein
MAYGISHAPGIKKGLGGLGPLGGHGRPAAYSAVFPLPGIAGRVPRPRGAGCVLVLVVRGAECWVYVPCMAFLKFNYVNRKPLARKATHWRGLSALRCSAPGDGDGVPPCGVWTSRLRSSVVRKFRVAPRASYAPLDRLPGRFRFRAGRSGWPKTQFWSTMCSGRPVTRSRTRPDSRGHT